MYMFYLFWLSLPANLSNLVEHNERVDEEDRIPEDELISHIGFVKLTLISGGGASDSLIVAEQNSAIRWPRNDSFNHRTHPASTQPQPNSPNAPPRGG